MKERRVYLVDYGDSPLPNWANKESLQTASDEDFMDCAEKQGYVFTLESFVSAFKHGEIPDMASHTKSKMSYKAQCILEMVIARLEKCV